MSKNYPKYTISEDWWAVIVAFVLFILSAIGWLGEQGLPIRF